MYLYESKDLSRFSTTLQPHNLTPSSDYAFGTVPSSAKGFGQGLDEEGLEYQSEDAARRTAHELLTKYEADCRDINVSKHLTKGKLSLSDEAILLQRRLKELPRLYQDKAELDRRSRIWRDSAEKNRVFSDPIAERRRIEDFASRTGALSPKAYRIELAKLLVRLGYPTNYYLRDLDTELRQARCEERINSLRLSGGVPCGGMEVDDPASITRQVADHYVQTELGLTFSNQRLTCNVFGRSGFCDVHYSRGITIRVNFSKVPYSLIAVQVAPKLGPQREYRYSCSQRKVNLSLRANSINGFLDPM